MTLENSKIQEFIKKSRRGNFIKVYRVLDVNEDKNDDETSKNDISKRDWLILCRYICDFIEDNNANCNGNATTDTNTKFDLF